MPPHCSSYARSAASPSRRKPTKWPFTPPLTRSLLPRVTCSVRWRRTPCRRIAPTWPPRRAPVQARECNATRLLRRHPRVRVGDHSLFRMHKVPRLLDLSVCLHRNLGMLGVLRLARSLWQAWRVSFRPAARFCTPLALVAWQAACVRKENRGAIPLHGIPLPKACISSRPVEVDRPCGSGPAGTAGPATTGRFRGRSKWETGRGRVAV